MEIAHSVITSTRSTRVKMDILSLPNQICLGYSC